MPSSPGRSCSSGDSTSPPRNRSPSPVDSVSPPPRTRCARRHQRANQQPGRRAAPQTFRRAVAPPSERPANIRTVIDQHLHDRGVSRGSGPHQRRHDRSQVSFASTAAPARHEHLPPRPAFPERAASISGVSPGCEQDIGIVGSGFQQQDRSTLVLPFPAGERQRCHAVIVFQHRHPAPGLQQPGPWCPHRPGRWPSAAPSRRHSAAR